MSAKDRIRAIAEAAARVQSAAGEQMISQRSVNKPTQGVVQSVNGASLQVQMLGGDLITVSAGNTWLVPGDICVVFGGRAF